MVVKAAIWLVLGLGLGASADPPPKPRKPSDKTFKPQIFNGDSKAIPGADGENYQSYYGMPPSMGLKPPPQGAKTPSATPSDGTRKAPGVAPVVALPPSPARQGSTRPPKADERRELPSELQTPLLLPAQKVHEASPDDAATLSRTDYGRHILGMGERDLGLSRPAGPADGGSGLGSTPAAGRHLLVQLDLRLPASGGNDALRDAVADLSRETGFKAAGAPRLHPLRDPHGSGEAPVVRASVEGFLPAEQVGEVVRRMNRLVERMTLEPVSGRADGGRTASPERRAGVSVTVRVPGTDPGAPGGALSILGELGRAARLETVEILRPGDGKRVVLNGWAPLESLPRLLAHEYVDRVDPWPGPGLRGPHDPPADGPSPTRRLSSGLSRQSWAAGLFLCFALVYFLVKTGLGSRLLDFFNPYRSA